MKRLLQERNCPRHVQGNGVALSDMRWTVVFETFLLHWYWWYELHLRAKMPMNHVTNCSDQENEMTHQILWHANETSRHHVCANYIHQQKQNTELNKQKQHIPSVSIRVQMIPVWISFCKRNVSASTVRPETTFGGKTMPPLNHQILKYIPGCALADRWLEFKHRVKYGKY